VENSGGTAACEKTVEVLPVGDIAFSLPEYGYTDHTEEVKLLTKNDLDGSMVWTLTKDGNSVPIPEGFTKGRRSSDPDRDWLLYPDDHPHGCRRKAVHHLTILPVIVPTVTASADKAHEDETVEIS